MTLTRLQITARLVAIIMAVISVATTKAQEIYRVESAPAAVQLRSNGLYDLALCPNIGIEIQTDLGLAWQLDYIGAWWNSPSRNRFFSNYAFQTEIRYYLASPKMTFPYTGHHVGLYGQMITYDFEFGGTGYQSRDLTTLSASVPHTATPFRSVSGGRSTLPSVWATSRADMMNITQGMFMMENILSKMRLAD